MSQRQPDRVDLLQGTLDLLILRTLQFGPAHGHAVARRIRQTSEEMLRVETGSLYPALHRLEARGWITASWKLSELGKRARYYSLTNRGRKELAAERTKWEQLSRAIGLVLNPPGQELS
jgi:PadR family transcriptional regulator PadR